MRLPWFEDPGEDLSSYRLNVTGPAPLLVVEILSKRSAQQRDLREKVPFYAKIGVAEYILVDLTGDYLPQKLLLKRLQADGTWKDEQDADGGVTSQLGFRLIIDQDGQVRLLNASTGSRYVRPLEGEIEARARHRAEQQAQAQAEARHRAEQQAQAEADARRQAQQQAQAQAEARHRAEQQAQVEAEARHRAEERIKALEAELAKMRGESPKP